MFERIRPVTLIFLMIGSFVVWLFLRERSLKEECSHYDFDFRFWRNIIIGAIVVFGIVFFIDQYYLSIEQAEYEEWKKKFRN